MPPPRPCQALHTPTQRGLGKAVGRDQPSPGGGERSPTVTYRGRAEQHCSPPTPPREGGRGPRNPKSERSLLFKDERALTGKWLTRTRIQKASRTSKAQQKNK